MSYVVTGLIIFLISAGIFAREAKGRRRKQQWVALCLVVAVAVPLTAYTMRTKFAPYYFANISTVRVLSSHIVRTILIVENDGPISGRPTCTVSVQPSDLNAGDYFRGGYSSARVAKPIKSRDDESVALETFMPSGDASAVTSISMVSASCK